jgi:hypothetical protein
VKAIKGRTTMRIKRGAQRLIGAACVALACVTVRVEAGSIGVLASNYAGVAYNAQAPGPDLLLMDLGISAKRPDGTFDGYIDELDIHGRVAPNGAVTFSGKSGGPNPEKVKGQAVLSYTGKYLVGTMSFTRTSPKSVAQFGFKLEAFSPQP